MTPKELCKYITGGKIFQDIPSGGAKDDELGRHIWPRRWGNIINMAADALNENKEYCDKIKCPFASKCNHLCDSAKYFE